MCDYSLMNIPNRLAADGEELVVHRFPSGSMGLTSPGDLDPGTQPRISGGGSFWSAVRKFFTLETCSIPAVCIPPSSRLLLHEIGEQMRQEHGLNPAEECIFEQLTAAANTYRDAIRFRNGCCLRLQELPEGQRVTVLSTAMLTENPVAEIKANAVLLRECA